MLGLALAWAGGVLEVRGKGHGEGGVGRSSSFATRCDALSHVEIFPRTDICSISSDTITTRHSSRPGYAFHALALPFWDGFLFSDSVFVRPPLPTGLHIHMGRSRAARSSLGIHRSFPGFYSPRSLRARDEGSSPAPRPHCRS
ncbi:hypothetical protein B0H13DRAFT_1974439 [Mycena leptocephala]|nr:hypothetical protein B0H13DRAFT_1974439 [Mycena leptocephala]